MKKTIFIIFLFIAAAVQAVPAFPDLITFRQPANEAIIHIYMKGDERVHWAETEDGYSLLHSDDGSFVYAMLDANGDMIPSSFLAADKEERTPEVEAFLNTVPRHIHFSQSQVESLKMIWEKVENAKKGPKTMSDVIGEKKFLLILFEFSDKPFHYSASQFRALMNQVNYTSEGRTGSVRDYYYDVSGGLFTLNMDVVGPFTGTRNLAFYGNTDDGYQAFAHEAVDSAAKYVNFADYDNDHDGYIDGLHIIFAGYGEESGASSDCIWSHKWNIFDAPTYNNTVIDVYSCSPECNGNSGNNITNIGVICHELGHVFGAPDYYDTDYGGSGGEYPGLGNWDIMSGGSWNCGGITPAHHNPYTKIYIYNWATCTTLDNTAAQYMLNPVAVSNNDFFRVNTSTQGDFFLIENRQNIKWDACLPSHGMLVYHIHPNAEGRSVNNARHPQQIYILTKTVTNQYPSNSPSSYGNVNSESAPFPGINGLRDSLTDNSSHWFRPWSQQPNNLPIRNIGEDTRTGKVYFSVQDVSPDPLSVIAEGLDNDKILLTWTRYGTKKTLILMRNDNSGFITPPDTVRMGDTLSDGSIVLYYGDSYSTVVNNLESGTRYYFKLFTLKSDKTFSNGITTDGTTLDCEVGEWNHEDFESTPADALPDCWTGDWRTESMDGQMVLASPSNSTSDHEWRYSISRPLYYDNTTERILTYRTHFYDGCSETTKLKVELQATTSSNWVTVDSLSWDSDIDNWDYHYITLSGLSNYSRLRFAMFSNGNDRAAIDDIHLTNGWIIHSTKEYGGDIEPLGYSVVESGDSLEYIITTIPGYTVHRLVYDTRVILPSRLTQIDDRHFSYKVGEYSGEHDIHAAFKRNNAIDAVAESGLNIYPNPTNGNITIECATGTLIKIYDTRGSLIKAQKTTSNATVINLGNLPKGVYILHCDNIVQKIIKK